MDLLWLNGFNFNVDDGQQTIDHGLLSIVRGRLLSRANSKMVTAH